MRGEAEGARRPALRLIGFAAGDFAFNLYWQSTTFFLLFYYTDALGLPVERAAAIFLVASVWDGAANLLAGWAADAGRTPPARRVLAWGAAPLGLAFLLTYWPAPPTAAGLALLLAANLLFRGLYALLNVSFLALSAEIAVESADRALLSGARMLFGTLAALAVALGTRPLGTALAGPASPAGFAAAAALFAVAGSALIAAIAASAPRSGDQDIPPSLPPLAALAGVFGNRAFVTLNLAMMAMIVAVTLLGKSTLYYFKYAVGNVEAGPLAIASMSVVGLIALPLWTALARGIGGRAVWFVACALAVAQLMLFAAVDVTAVGATQLFLVGLQAATVGLHFVFWALLPDTIEFGEAAAHGAAPRATVFGVAACLQRVSIGVATAIIGWRLSAAGYRPGGHGSAATLAALRWTIAVLPLGFLLLSALCMLLNPMTRGAHARVLARLGR